MKKVWVIEGGEYSDYHVSGVFSSKENAEAVMAVMDAMGPCDECVSEWILDPGVEEVRAGFNFYEVLMLRAGATEKVFMRDVDSYNLSGQHHIWRRSKALFYRGQGIKDVLQANVWARDEVHAVKIVNEIRTQMIANGEWK